MGRLAVMAHYDPRGEVGPHVRRQVEALTEIAEKVVVVSTADLVERDRAWLSRHAEVLARTNYGYDFFSYRTGLESVRLEDYDDVVVCNDTYVGPLVGYGEIVETMASRPADFWGLVASERIRPHVQSFFVCFRPWLVRSHAFRTFWAEMRPISDRARVITRYEIGLSQSLQEAGFSFDAYFRPTEADRRLARLRTWWWATRRNQAGRDPVKARQEMQVVRRGPWNPAIALADVALDGGRLPFLKIDTLRYDPYGLDAGKLLRLAEQRRPDAFAGVREYLEQTAPLYGQREEERLLPVPASLRPMRRLVEYGRAL